MGEERVNIIRIFNYIKDILPVEEVGKKYSGKLFYLKLNDKLEKKDFEDIENYAKSYNYKVDWIILGKFLIIQLEEMKAE